MEEKKLTDEEIVKALECLVKDGVYYGGVVHLSDILALVHRLQDEIAEYERKFDDGELVSKEWHDEQVLHDREEIERLTEENKHLDKLLGEKRLDELTVARQIVAQNCVLNEENAELQKQVDELKSRKIEPLIVKCPSLETCPKVEQAVKDTAKEIIAFVEDKDKKAGKFSIYRNLLCELKERYGVQVE